MKRDGILSGLSQASALLGSLFFAALVGVILLMSGSALMLEPHVVRAVVATALGLAFHAHVQLNREQSIASQVQLALVRQRYVPRKSRIHLNDPLLF
jgi:hypothetical protein